MKIYQLPMGARFEYEGQEYVKTGPMFATGPGGQRLIPKYAVLKAIGEVAAAPARKAPGLEVLAVRQAFETFYAACAPLVGEPGQAELAAARQRFYQTLGLSQ